MTEVDREFLPALYMQRAREVRRAAGCLPRRPRSSALTWPAVFRLVNETRETVPLVTSTLHFSRSFIHYSKSNCFSSFTSLNSINSFNSFKVTVDDLISLLDILLRKVNFEFFKSILELLQRPDLSEEASLRFPLKKSCPGLDKTRVYCRADARACA